MASVAAEADPATFHDSGTDCYPVGDVSLEVDAEEAEEPNEEEVEEDKTPPSWSEDERAAYLDSLGLVSLPGEEAVWRFLEDILSMAPLPAPWTTERDIMQKLFYVNQATGETSWGHPVEPVLRELAGICRTSLTLPDRVREACLSSMHTQWKAEAVHEYGKWCSAQDDNGEAYYCNLDTGEAMWDNPADSILPPYQLRLGALDKLRDIGYINRLQLKGEPAEALQAPGPSNPGLTEASSFFTSDPLEEAVEQEQTVIEAKMREPQMQALEEVDERAADKIRIANTVRQAFTSVQSQTIQANDILARSLVDDFAKAVLPLKMQVKDLEKIQAESSKLAAASKDKLDLQAKQMADEMQTAYDLVRPPHSNASNWWWTRTAPLQDDPDISGSKLDYLAKKVAKRRLDFTRPAAGVSAADSQYLGKSEDQIRRLALDRSNLNEQLMNMRESELRKRKELTRLRLEWKKRQLEMQWKTDQHESQLKAEMQHFLPQANRPHSQ